MEGKPLSETTELLQKEITLSLVNVKEDHFDDAFAKHCVASNSSNRN